jgi:hypothetical protein
MALLLLVLPGACTGPVRSYAVYESKAARTAKVAIALLGAAMTPYEVFSSPPGRSRRAGPAPT